MVERTAWRRWVLVAVAIISLLGWAIPTRAAEGGSKRVALVIGNSAYRFVPPLANPGNDARLMAATLTRLGFELVGGGPQLDLDKPAMERAIRQFASQLGEDKVGLFYYSGHGLQIGGENYLVPVGANPTGVADADFELVSGNLVLRQMTLADSGLNIIILDACRNNPFAGRGLRDVGGGLAQMQAPRGTLISYATQPGAVAADGADQDSPFTAALAQAMQVPNQGIFDLFNTVAVQVDQATHHAQQPWFSSSPIQGSFVFATPGSVVQRLVVRPQPVIAALPPPFPATPPPAAPDIPGALRQAVRAMAEHDYVGAQRGFRVAAEAGNADAQAALGLMYVQGSGVERDYVQAMTWYRRAADQNQPAAEAGIGLLYEKGLGVPVDPEEAARWYRRAADTGFAVAQLKMGELSQRGLGLPRDYGEAMRWYRKAADQGLASAQSQIGFLYSEGFGVPTNYAEALRWYRAAAERGDPTGENNIGFAYQNGLAVPRDYNEAAVWYRKAAEAGNTAAESNLGLMFQNGWGVRRDYAEAMRWYRKAADAGNAGAKLNIGILYQNGWGVRRDVAEALRWYRQAAEDSGPTGHNAQTLIRRLGG